MANTTVTEAACELCGAEIRDGSLYCYNCGIEVSANRAETESKHVETEAESVETEAKDVETEAENSDIAPVPEVKKNRPALRSAASLRKQRRAFNRQPVEVVWEPKEQTPKLFIFASITLAVGALVLLLIALYLR